MTSLSQRIAQVFDGLGAPGPTWQPAEHQVFRGGTSAVESSEDEKDEAQHMDPLIAGDPLDVSDGDESHTFQASVQFCKALDREEEFDVIDRIADAGELTDTRPGRNTQVLPNNAYEPRGSCEGDAAVELQPSSGAERSAADTSFQHSFAQGEPPLAHLSCDSPRTAPSPAGSHTTISSQHFSANDEPMHPRQPQHADIAGTSSSTQVHDNSQTDVQDSRPQSDSKDGSTQGGGSCISEDKKRVRFARFVPAQRRSSSEAVCQTLIQTSTGLKPSRPSIKGQTGRVSTSSVPEHVAHPERFDCYELDVPLIVGGGDRQPDGQGHSSQEQGACDVPMEASQQPDQQQTAALPQFGTGIEFRPRPKPKLPVTDDGSAAANASRCHQATAAALSEQLLEDEAEDGSQSGGVDLGSTQNQLADTHVPRAGQRRNYRKAAL